MNMLWWLIHQVRQSSFAGSHDIDITTVLEFVLSDILLGYGLWEHCSKYWYANYYEVAMYVYIILYELLWPYLPSYTWFFKISSPCCFEDKRHSKTISEGSPTLKTHDV